MLIVPTDEKKKMKKTLNGRKLISHWRKNHRELKGKFLLHKEEAKDNKYVKRISCNQPAGSTHGLQISKILKRPLYQ